MATTTEGPAAHRTVRTPTVLQMEATECGAASLTMILNWLGRDVLLEQVREACAVSRDGVNALKIVDAAKNFGLEGAGYRYSAEEVRSLEPPFMVFWNQNHFLVVDGFGRRKVHLNDPASGHRSVSPEEFAESYSGIVLRFSPGTDFTRDPRRRRRRPVVEMLRLPSRSRSGIVYALITGIAVVVPTTAAAFLTSIFADQVLAQGNTAWVAKVVVLAALVTLLLFGLSLFQHRVLLRLQTKLSIRMSPGFLWHLLRLPTRFFDARSPGGLVSRVQLNAQVAALLSGQLATAAISVITMVLFGVVLLILNWLLALVAIGVACFNLVTLATVSRARISVNQNLQQTLVRLSGYTYLGINMIDDIAPWSSWGTRPGTCSRGHWTCSSRSTRRRFPAGAGCCARPSPEPWSGWAGSPRSPVAGGCWPWGTPAPSSPACPASSSGAWWSRNSSRSEWKPSPTGCPAGRGPAPAGRRCPMGASPRRRKPGSPPRGRSSRRRAATRSSTPSPKTRRTASGLAPNGTGSGACSTPRGRPGGCGGPQGTARGGAGRSAGPAQPGAGQDRAPAPGGVPGARRAGGRRGSGGCQGGRRRVPRQGRQTPRGLVGPARDGAARLPGRRRAPGGADPVTDAVPALRSVNRRDRAGHPARGRPRCRDCLHDLPAAARNGCLGEVAAPGRASRPAQRGLDRDHARRPGRRRDPGDPHGHLPGLQLGAVYREPVPAPRRVPAADRGVRDLGPGRLVAEPDGGQDRGLPPGQPGLGGDGPDTATARRVLPPLRHRGSGHPRRGAADHPSAAVRRGGHILPHAGVFGVQRGAAVRLLGSARRGRARRPGHRGGGHRDAQRPRDPLPAPRVRPHRRHHGRPPLLAAPVEEVETGNPGVLSGRVSLRGVSFGYSTESPPVLEDVSFDIQPGEFAAITGPSGAGKSTLLRLLLGLDQPTSGTVLFDGKDLKSLDARAVRRQFGVVMQDARPLPGEILSTILGDTAGDETDAWAAADAAELGEDIRRMPMRMHTITGEGGLAFSGGQVQRMMVARALARKPKLLFFDEATSALDDRAQALVSRHIEELHATRIVIAHRLSTIRNADRIYVLEAGRLVQAGSFEELMSADGPFQRLAARQLV